MMMMSPMDHTRIEQVAQGALVHFMDHTRIEQVRKGALVHFMDLTRIEQVGKGASGQSRPDTKVAPSAPSPFEWKPETFWRKLTISSGSQL